LFDTHENLESNHSGGTYSSEGSSGPPSSGYISIENIRRSNAATLQSQNSFAIDESYDSLTPSIDTIPTTQYQTQSGLYKKVIPMSSTDDDGVVL